MATKQISLSLPIKMLEKIIEITKNDPIYEDHSDFILHAITDLLEEYTIKKGV